MDFLLFGIIILFYFYKPKSWNSIIGYRTRRSMKSEDNWKFAQEYFPKKWMIVIPVILICQTPVLLNLNSNDIIFIMIISLINFIILTANAIYFTEKALEEHNK